MNFRPIPSRSPISPRRGLGAQAAVLLAAASLLLTACGESSSKGSAGGAPSTGSDSSSPSVSSAASPSTPSAPAASSPSPTATPPSAEPSSSSPATAAGPSRTSGAGRIPLQPSSGHTVTTPDGSVSFRVPDSWTQIKGDADHPEKLHFLTPDGKGELWVYVDKAYATMSVPGIVQTGAASGQVSGVPSAFWQLGYFPGQAPGTGGILAYLAEGDRGNAKGVMLPGGRGVLHATFSQVPEKPSGGMPSEAEITAELQAFRSSQTGVDVRTLLSSLRLN